MRTRVRALHDEATRELEVVAPETTKSYLATVTYIEIAHPSWSVKKVRDVLELADYVAAIRMRHHRAAAQIVLVVAGLIGASSSVLARTIKGDTSAGQSLIIQTIIGLAVFAVVNEWFGKNIFVDRLRERRDAWRGAVKALGRRVTEAK